MSHPFLVPSPLSTQLKICGITNAQDALELIEHEVEALGFNFWRGSKRYISPEVAASFAPELQGSILRVGVFVNESPETILGLLQSNIIDVAQLHGDEDTSYCQAFAKLGYPFIKAIGVAHAGSLDRLRDYQASAILLDTHAPGVYGGTGDTFDWALANRVKSDYPDLSLILAGGITPANTAQAVQQVAPLMLDVASGAESAPGRKDFKKIADIQNAILEADKSKARR